MTEVQVYEGFSRLGEISDRAAASVSRVPQKLWAAGPDAAILLHDQTGPSLLAKMRRVSVRLEDLCEFCLGLTPYDKYSGHTEEEIREQVFHVQSRVDESCRRLLKSGDVCRYQVTWNERDWIRYGSWLAAPREERFFSEERILVQQIIDWSSLRIFAGLTADSLCNTQNQFNLLARPGTNLRTTLAVLNSRLISFYHREAHLDVGLQRFQKILVKDAKLLPIRRFDLDHLTAPEIGARLAEVGAAADITSVIGMVTAALRAHAIHHGPAGKPELREEYLAALDSLHPHQPMPPDISEDPADFAGREDFVHDLLATLAQRMMDLNKEKHAEIGRFVDNLQEQFGFDVEDLTKKTHIKGYHEAEFERLEAALRANRTKLSQPVEGFFAAQLRDDYEASMAILRPLEEKLTQTDRLIDQIVYRLYSLTPEEVAIVEGTAVDEPLDTAE